MRRAACLAAAALLGACDGPPVEDGAMQVANELRALRGALAAPASLDQQALQQAFAPLRDAVQALVAEQGALQQRQQALGEELGRWTALAARGASPEQQQQVAALQARLQQLEATLQAQDERHRAMEATVQQALDTTATRLESFLQGLERLRRAPSGAAENGAAPDHGGAAEPRRGAFATPRSQRAWLFAVLAAGLSALGVLAWRLAHPPAALAQAADGARDADDIWTAASALGLAVEAPRAVVAMAVVDERAALPPPAAPVPWRWSCVLSCRDPARALAAVAAALAGEPRVLRRPAPELRAVDGGVAVECALLPGLPAGEREPLRARLQQAAHLL